MTSAPGRPGGYEIRTGRGQRAGGTAANRYRSNQRGKARTHSRCPSTTSPSARASVSVSPPPPRGQRSERRADVELDREAGIGRAERHLAPAEEEVPLVPAPRVDPRLDPCDERRAGQGVAVDPPPHVGDQRVRVEQVGRELPREPPLSPHPELAQGALQLAPLGRQLVEGSVPVLTAAGDAGVDQLAQPGREHRPGDSRQATADLPEAPAAHEQLADHQQHPALTQHVEGAGDGAELAVARHAARLIRIRGRMRGGAARPR